MVRAKYGQLSARGTPCIAGWADTTSSVGNFLRRWSKLTLGRYYPVPLFLANKGIDVSSATPVPWYRIIGGVTLDLLRIIEPLISHLSSHSPASRPQTDPIWPGPTHPFLRRNGADGHAAIERSVSCVVRG